MNFFLGRVRSLAQVISVTNVARMVVPSIVLCLGVSSARCVAQAQSHWVHLGVQGKLVYAQTAKGDRIPDFSYAGYEGGGVALPMVPVKRMVAPSGGDDTAAIQKAIDEVSALPLVHGFRGAVELKAGTFHCAGTLTIAASGVVLRGAGDGKMEAAL